MAGFEHYAWLMKSEPSEVSVDDVLGMKDCKVGWFGVRNYQARNFMRDLCKIGDPVLFYHSSCAQPGIVGIGELPPNLIRIRRSLMKLQNISTRRVLRRSPAGFKSMCIFFIKSNSFLSLN